MTLRYNLHINQGETWQLTIPALPDTGAPPGNPLPSHTGRAQIRADPAAAVVLHEWSTTGGNLTITDDSVILTLPAATSSAWTWRRGVWDLELTDPGNGGTTRLAHGWVYVTPEITRGV